MAERRPVITLTSDFGLSDHYVAAMKAAVLRHCPEAHLVDVTHLTPRYDILAGSILLERAIGSFDAGTIHLAVVDPTVGSDRLILIVQIRDQWVVCPGNGLITWAWRRWGPGKAYQLIWRPPGFSATFHGRDVMAPVAGMLAAGRDLMTLSRPITLPLLLPEAPARNLEEARIIYIDHFGNAMTNVGRELLDFDRKPTVRVGGQDIGGLFTHYADVAIAAPLALVGSSGFLEIAVRENSAAAILNLHVGDEVIIR